MAFSFRPLALAILLGIGLAPSAQAQSARLAVGEVDRTANTPSAAARNHGDATLRILVWYPTRAKEAPTEAPANEVFRFEPTVEGAPFADERRKPLILMSHGFGGVARQMAWLGAALAREGYVVVAVDHPGTNGRDGVTAEGAYTPWERAGDLKAALDLVLADPVLGPHIDAKRIGVAGFSIGGFTATLTAGGRSDSARLIRFCNSPQRDAICDPQQEFPLDFNKQAAVLAQPGMHDLAARGHGDFRDARVKAAFLIAPATVQALDPASLAQIHIPVALVTGDADPVVPPKTNGEAMARLIPGATLKVLPGVGHYDFLAECGPQGLTVAKVYCTDGAGTRRAETHAATVAEAVTFFDKHVAGKR